VVLQRIAKRCYRCVAVNEYIKMKKAKRFKSFLSNFGIFAGLPSFISWIGGRLFSYNELYVFLGSLTIIWMAYTEFRIQDLNKKSNNKRK